MKMTWIVGSKKWLKELLVSVLVVSFALTNSLGYAGVVSTDKLAPRSIQSARNEAYEQRYSELLGIFGGDESLLRNYISLAVQKNGIKGKNAKRKAVLGMFNPENKESERRRIKKGKFTQISPGDKKVILAFGGGSGLLASIKPLHKLGAFVRSVQTSIDDGGATFKLVDGVRKEGYGWMPSVGDLVNTLFKGLASEDRLYKLLDDQGRIKLITDEMIEDAQKGKGLPLKDKEGNEITKNKIVFYDEDGVVYIDTFQELTKRLLKRIVQYTIINKKGIGYTRKTHKLSDDFVYFASSMLNIAKAMDEIYFAKKIVPKDGASIRNLALLDAVDYTGLIDTTQKVKKTITKPLLDDDDKGQKFQECLDLLAKMAGITDGRVSLSHNIPGTVYAIHEDNVIMIDLNRAKKVKKEWVNQKEPDLKPFAVKIEKEKITIAIIGTKDVRILTDRNLTEEIVLYTDKEKETKIVFNRTDGGLLAFKIGDSKTGVFSQKAILEEKGGKPADSVITYNGEGHNIAQDGTGMVRFTTTDAQNVYEYRPLEMGETFVYVRSRFTAMQTHITETPNYSKLSDFGFVAEKFKEEKVKKGEGTETRYRYTPDPNRRMLPNKELIDAIKDPSTKGIVIGPGSFATSILPHLLVKGLPEALKKRRAKDDIRIILDLNPTIDNETANMSITDMLNFICEKAGCNKIDELCTDLVINKFDTTKIEEHFRWVPFKAGDSTTKAARKYAREIIRNPSLVDQLGLGYINLLINKYQTETGTRTRLALAGPDNEAYVIRNDDGKKIKVGGEEMEAVTLSEYLTAKIQELLEVLYQRPKADIRTDPGDASSEAKKSRGPVAYTRAEIYKIKTENPRLYIHRDLFLGGIEFAPPREAGKAPEPRVGYLEDYTSFVLGDIFGLVKLKEEITKAYGVVQESIIKGKVDEKDDGGGNFRTIFTTYWATFRQQLSPQAQQYVDSLSLGGFRRLIDGVHIKESLDKNAKKGFGITSVVGLPFGEDRTYFEEKVDKIRERVREITNGRVKFNEEAGIGALHMTIQAITRTNNFEEDKAPSMHAALKGVQQTVGQIESKMAKEGLGNLSDTISKIAQENQPFQVKLSGFGYYYKDGELSFTLEPASEYTERDGKKTLKIKEAFAQLPTEAKGEALHISLGRVTRPLDDTQIEEINNLFNELKMGELPPVEIGTLKIVTYAHRSLTELVDVQEMPLGQVTELDLERIYSKIEAKINRLASLTTTTVAGGIDIEETSGDIPPDDTPSSGEVNVAEGVRHTKSVGGAI